MTQCGALVLHYSSSRNEYTRVLGAAQCLPADLGIAVFFTQAQSGSSHTLTSPFRCDDDARVHYCYTLRDGPPSGFGRTQNRQGLMIAFHDHFGALPHLLQHGVQILRQLRFADVDLRHILEHTSSVSLTSSDVRTHRRPT